tara:strand:- start:202 stop:879 length:678 start_codon:yes stop_codon:yes gene_type:complete
MDINHLRGLIKEVISEQKQPEKSMILSETTLSRVMKKVQDGDMAFVVMSADRHENSKKENMEAYRQLQRMFSNEGFPFAKVQGGWQEQDDEGNLIDVVENSIIVYNEARPDKERAADSEKRLFALASEMAGQYNQEAFIFGRRDPTTGERIIAAYRPDGSRITDDWAGPWSDLKAVPDDAPFWSRVRGSKFQFNEEVVNEEREKCDPPTSMIDAMKKHNSGKTWL